jgi:hypothetical protein
MASNSSSASSKSSPLAKRYGSFGKSVRDNNDEDKTLRQSRNKAPEELLGDDAPQGFLPPNPSDGTSGAKKSSSVAGGGFKDEPVLYDSPHKINKAYNTSIGSDALAGANIAMSEASGNPFHDIGLALGGLAGGAFNKNLAGKEKYKKDLKETGEYNRQVELRTESQIRLDAENRLRQKQADEMALKNQVETRRQQIADSKDDKQKETNLRGMIQTTDGQERKYYQQEHAKLMGYPNPEDVGDDYGVEWKSQKIGDITYETTKGGEIKAARDESGKVITNMTLNQWVDTLGKASKLDPSTDAETIKGAYKEALDVLKDYKGNFKTSKGAFNPVQYNAQVMQVATKILQGQKNPQGKASIPSEIQVDGVTIPIDIPILNVNKAPAQGSETKSDSQFMPDISGDKAPEVLDATSGPNTTPTPSGNKDYPLSFTMPQSNKKYSGREVAPPAAASGRRVPEGTVIHSKDGKTALLFKGGAWYEILNQ